MSKAQHHPDPTWPYEDVEEGERIQSEPTWACAAGHCTCHPAGETQAPPERFSILLCDRGALAMPSARCRVLDRGIVLNESEPHADADGWITVSSRRLPEQVLVEWAPPDTPLEPRFPLRKLYYVEPRRAERVEAGRRRLHNLGFSEALSLADNVRAFQRAYERAETGELADIEAELIAFHDTGAVPPHGDAPADPPLASSTSALFEPVAFTPRRRRGPSPAKPRGGPPSPDAGAAVPASPPPRVIVVVDVTELHKVLSDEDVEVVLEPVGKGASFSAQATTQVADGLEARFADNGGVPAGRYRVWARRREGGKAVAEGHTGAATDPLFPVPVVDIQPSSSQPLAVQLRPLCRIEIRLVDAVDAARISPGKLKSLQLNPPAEPLRLDAGKKFYIADLEVGKSYEIGVDPLWGLHLAPKTIPTLVAEAGVHEVTVKLPRRSKVLYAIIDDDSPENGTDRRNHDPNIAGLKQAIADSGLDWLDRDPVRRRFPSDALVDEAFLVFSAGSFPFWNLATPGSAWLRELQKWTHKVRNTAVPTLAVCGSHQLFAVAADNGFSASGNWDWKNTRYSEGHLTGDKAPPGDPTKLPGEFGEFKVAVTKSDDPFLKTLSLGSDPIFSLSHSMEVTSTPAQATRIFGPRGDNEGRNVDRTIASDPTEVEGLSYTTKDKRPFYTVQFHPEVGSFATKEDSAKNDGGNGQKFLIAYLKFAHSWWKAR